MLIQISILVNFGAYIVRFKSNFIHFSINGDHLEKWRPSWKLNWTTPFFIQYAMGRHHTNFDTFIIEINNLSFIWWLICNFWLWGYSPLNIYTKYVYCRINYIKFGQNTCFRYTNYIEFGLGKYIRFNKFQVSSLLAKSAHIAFGHLHSF